MSEHIGHFIDDLYSQNYIDKHTYLLLTPLGPRLYFLKKIHKPPPPSIQSIVSSYCGLTEKIFAYLDHYLKPLVPLVPTYTRDSGHVISTLKTTPFSQNCILATIDVSSLYLNIPQDEGTFECFAVWQLYSLSLPPAKTNLLSWLQSVYHSGCGYEIVTMVL